MKKIFKIALLILILAVIATAFTACRKNNNNNSENNEDPKSDVVSYMTIHEDDACVRHAAYELSSYSMKSTGSPINAYTPAAWATLDNLELTPTADKTIYLGTSEWYSIYYPELMMDLYENSLEFDGYVIATVEGGWAIMSNYNRGVLYGVYNLLKDNGFGFYGSIEGYEYIPSLEQLEFPKTIKVNNPSFEIRSMEFTGALADYTEETDYIRILSWAGKNGVNELVSEAYSQYIGNAVSSYGFASLRGKTAVVDKENATNGIIAKFDTTIQTNGYRVVDNSAQIAQDVAALYATGVKGIAFSMEKFETGYMYDSDLYCLVNAMWNASADLTNCAKAVFDFKYAGTSIDYQAYTAVATASNSALSAKAMELFNAINDAGTNNPFVTGNEAAKMKLSALYASKAIQNSQESFTAFENYKNAINYLK